MFIDVAMGESLVMKYKSNREKVVKVTEQTNKTLPKQLNLEECHHFMGLCNSSFIVLMNKET